MLDKSKFTPDSLPVQNPLVGGIDIGKTPPAGERVNNAEVGVSPEKIVSSPAEVVQNMVTAMPLPQVSATNLPTALTNDPTATTMVHLDDAADLDVIEKAWVDKAKNIVAKTSTDPRLQNEELAKVKADYIKKRFGKDVKIAQEDVNK